LFIFSAKSFNQAYKRYLYIQNYSARRKHYISLMENTSEKLEKQKKILEQKMSEKQQVNAKYQQQLQRLQDEFEKKEQLLAELRQKEEEVRKKLKNQVKLARELDKKISQSILNNLTPGKVRETEISESTEEAFSNYKGELPWPVNNGVIMNGFGEKPHPFLSNVTISNSGIDISTLANAQVKAVFDGKVVKVVKIPGINYSVLLKHGTYYTLYSNLKDLQVEKGDYVFAGDVLGRVDFDFQNEEQYYIKFQVWHKSHKLNPVAWLKDK
jgi:septal ring factor EnvC (AmiA/AmiB activator)